MWTITTGAATVAQQQWNRQMICLSRNEIPSAILYSLHLDGMMMKLAFSSVAHTCGASNQPYSQFLLYLRFHFDDLNVVSPQCTFLQQFHTYLHDANKLTEIGIHCAVALCDSMHVQLNSQLTLVILILASRKKSTCAHWNTIKCLVLPLIFKVTMNGILSFTFAINNITHTSVTLWLLSVWVIFYFQMKIW